MQTPLWQLHPLVKFTFFLAVFGFAMWFLHPICLLISLSGASLLLLRLGGGQELRSACRYGLPLFLLTLLLNPLFNHRGATILFYFPNGNPCTGESLLYGTAAATLLLTVLLWFRCYSLVMTSDQFVYLFGRVSPSLALLLSMTLRFVPQFLRQFRSTAQAQATIGRSVRKGPLRARVQTAFACFSIVVTRALETAAETAQSMKSRGFGLPGRTAFSIYTFTLRDRLLLIHLLLCSFVVLSSGVCSLFSFQYYPRLMTPTISAWAVCGWLFYAALCLTPTLLLRKEARLWRSSSCNT